MKVLLVGFIGIVLLVFFYKTRERVPFYDFNKAFDREMVIKLTHDSADVTKFDFCKIISSEFDSISEWDYVIIVPPYLGMGMSWSFKLYNFWSVMSDVDDFTYNDGVNTMLFIKRRKIIAYGTLNQSPININYNVYKSQNSVLPIIKRSNCNNLFLERKYHNKHVYYIASIKP